jgi:hypothetical protein
MSKSLTECIRLFPYDVPEPPIGATHAIIYHADAGAQNWKICLVPHCGSLAWSQSADLAVANAYAPSPEAPAKC